MSYRITGLPAHPFAHLFGLDDAGLSRHGAQRLTAGEQDRFPDRIELRLARPGETVLLVNHEHQSADTPYRARHAVFVREYADTAFDAVDRLPAMLRSLMSLRAFDAQHMMVDADVAEGDAVEPLIERLLARPDVAYVHAHYARRGCYAALIRRG
ncbi:DUF1203 domain-containing protein [Roseateles sp. DC23W]|uniref:DUF1203 domain-containing protein n=1 Tax=Pelomonas dachongensis TaxID=3299029 RepID=A0ABW7ESL2_9BURK